MNNFVLLCILLFQLNNITQLLALNTLFGGG